MEHDAALDILDAGDGVALLVLLGITATDEHHAHHGTLVKLYRTLVQVAVGNTLEEVNDVALKAQHHTFGLRVTHTAVVLDNHRFAIHVDKSEEDEPLIVDTLFG